MSKDTENQTLPPEPEGAALTVEQLSEFAEWLETRLDALDARFTRFDQISTRNTRQFSEDMMQTRKAVTHLHERTGQLIAGNHRVLRDLLRAEIRAALEEDRRRMVRAAWRRTLWTFAVLFVIVAGLGTAGLVWLGVVPLPSQ